MKEAAVSIRRDGRRIWRGTCGSDSQLLAALIRKPLADVGIIGAGVYVMTGAAASNYAGLLSFALRAHRTATPIPDGRGQHDVARPIAVRDFISCDWLSLALVGGAVTVPSSGPHAMESDPMPKRD